MVIRIISSSGVVVRFFGKAAFDVAILPMISRSLLSNQIVRGRWCALIQSSIEF